MTESSRRRARGRSVLYPAMLVLLIADLFLIGVLVGGFSVHSALGLVVVAAVAWHVLGRRRWLGRALRAPGAAGPALWRAVFLGIGFVAVTVSGLVQWSGVAAAKPWHSTSMIVFTVALVLHLIANRRPLGRHLTTAVQGTKRRAMAEPRR